jgi:hypothetical protein
LPLELACLAVVRLLLIALPFLAAVGGLYWMMLRKYDISYYLAPRPSEFKAVVALGVPGRGLHGRGHLGHLRPSIWRFRIQG